MPWVPLYSVPPTPYSCMNGDLTIDGQGHLSLPGSYPGHHRSAHILPSILLADGFEGQALFIAQDLGESERMRHDEWVRALSLRSKESEKQACWTVTGPSLACQEKAGLG